MLKRSYLVLVVLVGMVLTGVAAAQDGRPQYEAGRDYLGRLPSGGVTRGYLLHIPTGYDPATPMPLVLSYHGFTADPVQNAGRTRLSTKADEAGFIVAYPAGQRDPMGWFTQPGAVEQGWLDDVQFTRDLLTQLQRDLNIDPARIYLTGFSNGGGMIHRLACDLSDVVAAIAPVSGPHFAGDPCDISRAVPVFGIYGKIDPHAPYEGYYDLLLSIPEWVQEWATRDECDAEPVVTTPEENVTVQTWQNCGDGAEVILRTYELGGHTWPIGAEDMIWDFFVAHPLPEQYLTPDATLSPTAEPTATE